MFGASDRMLVDGSKDAWVFGSSDVPQAVPAPGALLALAAAARRSRRR
jgi:MYXO-CTERM domain-containing protein